MILGGGGSKSPSVPTYLPAPKGASAAPPAAEAPSWARPPFEGYIGRDQPDEPVKPRPTIIPLPPAGALPVVETEVKPKGSPAPGAAPSKISRPKRPGDRRELQDYSYTLSIPERLRVQQENPKASDVVTTEGDTATPLSWEEYDKLSGDQRAAVDFNTMLVQAREVDLAADEKWYSDSEKAQYAKDVAEMFGPLGGSDKLGIKTVELLKKIDFKAVGQDLDEFLSLERAVTSKELKNFSFSKKALKELSNFSITVQAKPQEEAVAEYMAARTNENMAAVDTAAIKAALDAYKNTITSGGAGVWDPAVALGPLQPSAAMMTMPAGYGRASSDGKALEFDRVLESAYDALRANPNETGLAAVIDHMNSKNWADDKRQELWDYINDRTLRETQYLNDSVAQEIRAALGWK